MGEERETIYVRIIETPEGMNQVEALQRFVWTDNETEVVPVHVLMSAVRHGGLVLGAYSDEDGGQELVGFVFGFPGLYSTPDGPRPQHVSHMLGVHPQYRDQGIGFRLKRAQWQMVRNQQLDRIVWTYDPLMSRNAYLNVAKLGAVCNTYLRDAYGVLRDGLNVGVPSDRFQVDWWVNSSRVNRRLSRKVRRRLDLAHFYAAGSVVTNPTQIDEEGWPTPSREVENRMDPSGQGESGVLAEEDAMVLVEIPSDFLALKEDKPNLATSWRFHTRTLFEELFDQGYLVTDFIHLPGTHPRSFYVLSHGESTL